MLGRDARLTPTTHATGLLQTRNSMGIQCAHVCICIKAGYYQQEPKCKLLGLRIYIYIYTNLDSLQKMFRVMV